MRANYIDYRLIEARVCHCARRRFLKPFTEHMGQRRVRAGHVLIRARVSLVGAKALLDSGFSSSFRFANPRSVANRNLSPRRVASHDFAAIISEHFFPPLDISSTESICVLQSRR